jgi:hypothetical protein
MGEEVEFWLDYKSRAFSPNQANQKGNSQNTEMGSTNLCAIGLG